MVSGQLFDGGATEFERFSPKLPHKNRVTVRNESAGKIVESAIVFSKEIATFAALNVGGREMK